MNESCPPESGASHARQFLEAITGSLGVSPEITSQVTFFGRGDLPSIFAVSDLAVASMAAAAAAAAELLAQTLRVTPSVRVSRPLASHWFGYSLQPIGWQLPAPWDPIAGDYRGKDGWIRLHTNAPHHRAAALGVLGVAPDKAAVSNAVATWDIESLETAITDNKGCAAAMRSLTAWAQHPQGRSVNDEPLIASQATSDRAPATFSPTLDRPLAGIRVLDLTRVLAGPVATRFLAGLGAEVLRLDPPDWDEPAVIPDVTLGKRCARVNLRHSEGRAAFLELLHEADVLVHGYRSDALDDLGLDALCRRRTRPGLIDVSLDAYGWSGPWCSRRGFDSLVQMSAGIADAGMRVLRRDRPTPLPVQALDHATGYLVAAAALRGLTERAATGQGYEARASLARTARLLSCGPQRDASGELPAPSEEDWCLEREPTAFGAARRLRSPVTLAGVSMHWERPATRLGSSAAVW